VFFASSGNSHTVFGHDGWLVVTTAGPPRRLAPPLAQFAQSLSGSQRDGLAI